ncbi:helix-turn-helix domain-containing protein [Azospirillum argentinense]
MVQLGDRLKAVREFLGETQKSMSRRFRLGENTWQSYELNGKLPKGETLAELAALGIDMNWLLTGTGRMRASADPPDPGDGALPAPPRESRPSRPVLDLTLLSEAIALVEQGLADRRRRLSPRAMGKLVAALYGLTVESGDGSRPAGVSPAAVTHLLWLALQMDDGVSPALGGDGAVRPP